MTKGGGGKWQQEQNIQKTVCDFLQDYKGSTVYIISRALCNTTCLIVDKVREKTKAIVNVRFFGGGNSVDLTKIKSDQIILVDEKLIKVISKKQIKKELKKNKK